MTRFILLIGCGWLSAGLVQGAGPVLRLVKAGQPGARLLRNGDFEQAAGGKLSGWAAAPGGYVAASAEGRNGSQALRCDNASGSGWFGASQTLELGRTNRMPLVVRGWSKAEKVNGGADSGYSLYVDIVYADGTPLWGQTANFHTGTHDWEQREVVILPEKPVQTLTLHCLLRGHSGQAWFDDVSVEEIKAEAGAVLFEGVAVTPGEVARTAADRLKPDPQTEFRTGDGLEIMWRGSAVASLRVDGEELAGTAPSGFLARDVGANSDIYGFALGECPELGLKLQSSCRAEAGRIVLAGRVLDTTGRDRAVTLFFALPVDGAGWHWGDDIRRNRVIGGQGEFANTVAVQCGATGTMSVYPLGAIYSERAGLALALDMAHPAQYRIEYHAGTKQFFIAYDFGLAPETERFPGGADFRFVLYRFEPRWGFRGAFQKLREIFPDYFRVRARGQGLWMPFTDVSTVQGWQDFGFKFHEGNNNVPWDDAHGILSFRYTEPMTWWMRLGKDAPRTMAEALRVRDGLARAGVGSEAQMARVSQAAAMWDETGQPSLVFRNEPWCNGAVWSLNPNPAIPAVGQGLVAGESAGEKGSFNAATVYWNEAIKQGLYGPGAKGELDGEYLDSLEGYVTADLNFRREHFRWTSVPLTFAGDTKRPALYKGMAVFEFTKWFCEEVHGLGKLTFANGVPYRFTFLCPWLDVLGTETDWLSGGKYRPPADAQMSLWRTMSGGKPYLLLMNTDYNTFTPDLVERYFQRSLFYGMWPGMFSHNAADNPYWQNPKWYNRDRPLFKKYVPLIRYVAEAGWQPVTGATCDNERVWVERFGPAADGSIYLTVFNGTAMRQAGTVRVDAGALGLTRPRAGQELVSGNALNGTMPWQMSLGPEEVQVIRLSSRD